MPSPPTCLPYAARTRAALDYLDRAMAGHWSVEQFRVAVELESATARWQNVNASLRAIEVALAPPA